MAIEKKMSSIKPAAPKSPPKVAPGEGKSGQAGVEYGARQVFKVKSPNASEMSGHFTSSEGKASKPGKEASNEGTVSKAGKPGYL